MIITDYKVVSLSFFNKPVYEVANTIEKVFKKYWKITIEKTELNFPDIYIDAPPKENIKDDILLWEPLNSNHTFFMCPLTDGWQTLIKGIQEELNCQAIRFIYTSNDLSDKGYIADFEYIDEGIYRRICVYEENDKYEYFESGQPLWFEDKINLLKKNKKNRLNKEVIKNYLERLKIDITNQETFKSTLALKLSRHKKK